MSEENRTRTPASGKHQKVPLDEGEDRFWHIINRLSDAIILADAEGIVRMVNPTAEKLFGRGKDEFIGSSFGFPLTAGETSELEIIGKDGTSKVGEMRTVKIQWENQEACLAAIRDITVRKKIEEDLRIANEKILEQQEALKREIRSAHRRISEMVTLDELTGLHNRRYFMEALDRERARAERHKKSLSLCMIDIDCFKKVNDKLGHTAGDIVLANMGEIIREWSPADGSPLPV